MTEQRIVSELIDDSYDKERVAELKALFRDKTFSLIERGGYLNACQNIFTKKYRAKQVYIEEFAPDDLVEWVKARSIDVLMIHAQTLIELEQIMELKRLGYQVGVILRGQGGSFPEGYLPMVEKIKAMEIPCFPKLLSVREITNAIAIVLKGVKGQSE
jgi:hypothetical protein